MGASWALALLLALALSTPAFLMAAMVAGGPCYQVSEVSLPLLSRRSSARRSSARHSSAAASLPAVPPPLHPRPPPLRRRSSHFPRRLRHPLLPRRLRPPPAMSRHAMGRIDGVEVFLHELALWLPGELSAWLPAAAAVYRVVAIHEETTKLKSSKRRCCCYCCSRWRSWFLSGATLMTAPRPPCYGGRRRPDAPPPTYSVAGRGLVVVVNDGPDPGPSRRRQKLQQVGPNTCMVGPTGTTSSEAFNSPGPTSTSSFVPKPRQLPWPGPRRVTSFASKLSEWRAGATWWVTAAVGGPHPCCGLNAMPPTFAGHQMKMRAAANFRGWHAATPRAHCTSFWCFGSHVLYVALSWFFSVCNHSHHRTTQWVHHLLHATIFILQPSVQPSATSTRLLLLWCRYNDSASIWVFGMSFFYLRRQRQQDPSVAGILHRRLHRPALNRRYARSVHPGARVFDAPAYTLHWRIRSTRRLSRCCLLLRSLDLDVLCSSLEDPL